MSKNQIALSSLAMDLKRVAVGYHRGSITMASRFLDEALKRKSDVDSTTVKPYVKKLLNKVELLKTEKDLEKLAEDALMYSALFKNASLKTKYNNKTT